jgi:hypothetical protein
VATFLHKHAEQLGPLADATVAQLGLADKAVVCVPGEMSAINAFASMAVSALRIVLSCSAFNLLVASNLSNGRAQQAACSGSV